MNDPASRKNKYSKEYREQGNVDYNIMAPLYHDGSTFPFPCKGFPKGLSTKTINGNTVSVTLEGSAIHGGGHCQFGVTYDDNTFVVLKTVIGDCLISGMNYNFDLPPNIPSGDITVFWTWVNKIGNRDYYMECADITVNNDNGNNLPVEIQGKELLVVNILDKPIIPEGLPVGNDGIDLLNARKDISITSNGGDSQLQSQLTSSVATFYFRVEGDQPGCPTLQTFNDGNIYGPCSVQYGALSKYWVAIKNGGQHCNEQITASYGDKVLVLTVMDECPACGVDNHVDMSLDALIELTGSVNAACAINTEQPRIMWRFGGSKSSQSQLPPQLKSTLIQSTTTSRTSRTRRTRVRTTCTVIPKKKIKSIYSLKNTR